MQAEIGNPDGGGTLYAVIMAGGKGTRFWPRSRERMPKHLLDIVGERTIIQETLARLSPLIPPDRTLVVTGASHAEELMRQLPEVPPDNILIEPMGRNTAPCIGLAALAVNRRSPGAVMAVLPADHLIRDEARFRQVLAAAHAYAGRDQHAQDHAGRQVLPGRCPRPPVDALHPPFGLRGSRRRPHRAAHRQG